MPTVLLIEDDDESRWATAELFSVGDWTVLQAEDGAIGIDLALKHRPDVILCDLLMSKANGFQVCRAIRQQLQPTKIIVISGRDYGVDRASAIEAGADDTCSSRSRGRFSPRRSIASCRSSRASPCPPRTAPISTRHPPASNSGACAAPFRRRARPRCAMAGTRRASRSEQTARSSCSTPGRAFGCSAWNSRKSSAIAR